MTTTLANTSSLYTNENGAIRCTAHAGHYFGEVYAIMPERDTYQTPNDVWSKVKTDFIMMWVDEFGTAPKCGMC